MGGLFFYLVAVGVWSGGFTSLFLSIRSLINGQNPRVEGVPRILIAAVAIHHDQPASCALVAAPDDTPSPARGARNQSHS
jgi:hypothetical protein